MLFSFCSPFMRFVRTIPFWGPFWGLKPAKETCFLLDTRNKQHLQQEASTRKVKRDSNFRRFYTIDAKNTSDECNLNSSQLTLEPLRGAVQTRCTQKARIGESP